MEDYPVLIIPSTHKLTPVLDLAEGGIVQWTGNPAWCSQFEHSTDGVTWRRIGVPVGESEGTNSFTVEPRFLVAPRRFFRLYRWPLVTSPIPLPAPGGEENHQFLHRTFVHGGITRNYRLKLPNNWSPSRPWPFVLVLPGHGQSVEEFWNLHTGFFPLANGDDGDADPEDGWILCFAESILGEDNYRWDCYNDPNPDNPGANIPWIDDYGFLKALCDKLVASGLNIDTQRMYATGFSNGANCCHYISSKSDHPFAAFAMVDGGVAFSRSLPDGTPYEVDIPLPARPCPVLINNQLDSAAWAYEGRKTPDFNFGSPAISARDCVARWATVNGVPGATADAVTHLYTLPDPSPADASFYAWTAQAGPVMKVFQENIRPDVNWPQGLYDLDVGWNPGNVAGFPLGLSPKVPGDYRALYPHVLAPDPAAPTVRAIVLNGTWSREVWRPGATGDAANVVELITMSTGGHRWPRDDSPWDGHVEVLKFFEAH